MKKIITICLFLMSGFSMSVNAQCLTQQMCQLYNGHVKTLVQRVQGVTGETKIAFDNTGKVLSVLYPNGNKLECTWIDDNGKIEFRGFISGFYQGIQIADVREMQPARYDFSCGGIDYEVLFNENGTMSKEISSGGGYTRTQTYYYNPGERFPYKCVLKTAAGESLSAYTVLAKDSHDNVTKFSVTTDNQTTITTLEIEYYP